MPTDDGNASGGDDGGTDSGSGGWTQSGTGGEWTSGGSGGTFSSGGTFGMGGTGGGDPGGSGSGGDDPGTGGQPNDVTCPLPSTFKWTSTGPLAQPKGQGWYALKDFSVTKYNDKYIVFGTVPTTSGWNGFFSVFSSFDQWATAEQHFHNGHVAPTIFYFSPKDIWVLAYQWPFQYRTTKTPDVWESWSTPQSLMSYSPAPWEDNKSPTGPIDQTIICDDTDCYLFFNDDAGGVYRASMPIEDFPGQFKNPQRILNEPTSIIFEGVQVYSIKGSNKYLMINENVSIRVFRAWVADHLGGEWTPLNGSTNMNYFAGEDNVTWPGGTWTRDISHGDIVRENPSEKMEIDPCHLQMVYQGRDPKVEPDYDQRPYRPGLLTLVNE